MIKKQLLLSILILNIASGTTFSMFNKFTQPAQDALKKEFASTLTFSKILPESLDTLVAYNKNKRNNAIVRLFLAAPIAAVAVLTTLDSIGTTDDTKLKNFLFITSIASFVYTAKKGHSVYKRQWMVHHLKKIKNNTSNLLDTLMIKCHTHQDIKNSITRATVVPSHKKTDLTKELNINNPETLAEVLSGKFNTSQHTLTAVQ